MLARTSLFLARWRATTADASPASRNINVSVSGLWTSATERSPRTNLGSAQVEFGHEIISVAAVVGFGEFDGSAIGGKTAPLYFEASGSGLDSKEV
jgi:hypothetical protein